MNAEKKVFRLVIALVIVASPTLAGNGNLMRHFQYASVGLVDFGDLRIYGGGDSGRLEFQLNNGTWGTVCDSGFDDDAGDVACKQLGYRRSTDILDDQL